MRSVVGMQLAVRDSNVRERGLHPKRKVDYGLVRGHDDGSFSAHDVPFEAAGKRAD